MSNHGLIVHQASHLLDQTTDPPTHAKNPKPLDETIR